MKLFRYCRLLALCLGLGALSANALGATYKIDIPTYIPAASASGGYVSSLRVINKDSAATPVIVTVIDGATGLAGATGTLTASLPAQAAVTYTAQQIERALGVTLLASDRHRIRVTAKAQIEAQSFLLQPGGILSEISDSLKSALTSLHSTSSLPRLTATVRNYVPAAMAPSGYVSYLRVANTGTTATAVKVARVDPATGQAGAAGTLNASLPAGAAITYSAAQVEAVLGGIAESERSRIEFTGPSTLDVQTFLLQPNRAFTNHSSGRTGRTIDVPNYVPSAVNGYSSYLRVINDGSVAAPVTVALIDDVTGGAGAPEILIPSLPGYAAMTLTSSQVEAALRVIISADARPRIRIETGLTPALRSTQRITVQSFLLQPGGAFDEISNVSSGTTVDVRTYIPAADAGSGYTSYLRVINTGVSATPVTVAVIDGATGVVGSAETLIASLPAGGAKTLSSAQVERGISVAAGARPRLRITGNTILEVQSYMVQPGGAFTEMSGGQGSRPMPLAGLMGGAMQGTNLGFLRGVVTTLAGSGAYGSVDNIGTAATFSRLCGITTDGTNLYVADMDGRKIRKVVIATGKVTTLAGTGAIGAANGIGALASFSSPCGITTDGTNLYVADRGNNKIRKVVIASGAVTTLAGTGAIGAADGIGALASFSGPYGITTDGINLYVADSGNNKIRVVEIGTGAVTTLAGTRAIGAADGTGTAASFSAPYGITTDDTYLYVADGNKKIRKVVINTGMVTTLAGSGANGAADGIGALASFSELGGITTDGTNLYVTDLGSHNIRKVGIGTGAVTTLAGSGAIRAVDGTGTEASFLIPYGITTDGHNLYVADSNKIRKIERAVSTVTGFSPVSGLAGTSVTITGTGFDIIPTNNTVQFNRISATVTAATKTSLIVTVPVGAANGEISVVTPSGTAYRCCFGPAVTDFSPKSGAAGTSVTITGAGFDIIPTNNTVKFNGISATVTAATKTSLIVTVPVGAVSGQISVVTPSGNAYDCCFGVVSTVTGFSPGSGTAGTSVTITGTGFDITPANNTVKFNGISATVTAATKTSLTVTVPVGATTGAISVVTPSGAATPSAGSFVVVAPVVVGGGTAGNGGGYHYVNGICVNSTGAPAINPNIACGTTTGGGTTGGGTTGGGTTGGGTTGGGTSAPLYELGVRTVDPYTLAAYFDTVCLQIPNTYNFKYGFDSGAFYLGHSMYTSLAACQSAGQAYINSGGTIIGSSTIVVGGTTGGTTGDTGAGGTTGGGNTSAATAAALACKAQPYAPAGGAGDPQVDDFAKVAQFDACLHRAGYPQYDDEGRTMCTILAATLQQVGSNWNSSPYCPYPY